MQFTCAKVHGNTKQFWIAIFECKILPVIDHWKLCQQQHIQVKHFSSNMWSFKFVWWFPTEPEIKIQRLCSSVYCTRALFKMSSASVYSCKEKRLSSPTDVTITKDESASELLCGKLNLFYVNLQWFLFVIEHNSWELLCFVFRMPSPVKKCGRIDDHLSTQVFQITFAC